MQEADIEFQEYIDGTYYCDREDPERVKLDDIYLEMTPNNISRWKNILFSDDQTVFDAIRKLHSRFPNLDLLEDSLANQIKSLKNHKSAHIRHEVLLWISRKE
jgi:hypothetical protein